MDINVVTPVKTQYIARRYDSLFKIILKNKNNFKIILKNKKEYLKLISKLYNLENDNKKIEKKNIFL